MPALNEIVASLYGAWRLARFDSRGLSCFSGTLAGFWRSFFAAVIVAPLYAIAVFVPGNEAGASSTAAFGFVEAIAYVVSWVAYPVAVEMITQVMGCRERFLVYMTAYNWSAVIQHTIIAAIVILTTTDVLPLSIGQVLWLVATIYLLVYIWFIARTALAIRPLAASALVAIDLLLSYLITSVASAIEVTMTQIPPGQ